MNNQTTHQPEFPGYKSYDAKRAFLAATLLAIGAAMLVRLIIAYLMPLEIHYADVDSVVEWQGDHWYVSTADLGKALATPDDPPPQYITRSTPRGPEQSWAVPNGSVRLIPRDDKLWILSSEGLVEFNGDTMTRLPGRILPGPITAPFQINGHPAVLVKEKETNAGTVYIHDNQDWQKNTTFPLPPEDTNKNTATFDNVWLVMADATPHIFLRRQTVTEKSISAPNLYAHKGYPTKDTQFPADWQHIAAEEHHTWNSGLLDNRPAVFYAPIEDRPARLFRNTVAGSAPVNNEWETQLTVTLNTQILNLGAYRNLGRQHLVLQTFPCLWMYHVLGIENGKITTVRQVGSFSPFAGKSAAAAGRLLEWVVPLALIFLLAHLIRKHRTPQYVLYDAILVHASIARRALARIIDSAITLAPFLSLAILFLATGPITSFPALRNFWLCAAIGFWGGLVWFALIGLLFSYSEGRWGKTPGKWLLGITVIGIELNACGFKRALFRNLLLLLDASLDLMIGILCVSFTQRHQRVGDLIAHTIVIADTHTQPLPGSHI